MSNLRATLILVLTLAATVCATAGVAAAPAGGPTLRAVAWPEADALFHREPRWLGGDGAYSIDLGGDRFLWSFGDSFVATSPALVRRESAFVHNSVAVQTGRDPSTATMQFAWREGAAGPSSFFPEEGDEWFWPGSGLVLGGRLYVFLMQVARTDAADPMFGFGCRGWRCVVVDRPDLPPRSWRLRWLATPPDTRVILGSGSVLCDRGHVYAFGSAEDGSKQVFLARWPEAEVLAGDLSRPRWWCGRRFEPGRARARPLFSDAQTEFTVHREPSLRSWLLFQGLGFGSVPLSFRSSPTLHGPWTAPQPFFETSERGDPGLFLYAVKAHPWLSGAPLAVTYVTNPNTLDRLVDDMGAYFPRFVKVEVSGR